jgi:hypothetical protein
MKNKGYNIFVKTLILAVLNKVNDLPRLASEIVF